MMLEAFCFVLFFVSLAIIKFLHKKEKRKTFLYGLCTIYAASILPYALFLWGIVPIERFLLIDLPILYVIFLILLSVKPSIFKYEQEHQGKTLLVLVFLYWFAEGAVHTFLQP